MCMLYRSGRPLSWACNIGRDRYEQAFCELSEAGINLCIYRTSLVVNKIQCHAHSLMMLTLKERNVFERSLK